MSSFLLWLWESQSSFHFELLIIPTWHPFIVYLSVLKRHTRHFSWLLDPESPSFLSSLLSFSEHSPAGKTKFIIYPPTGREAPWEQKLLYVLLTKYSAPGRSSQVRSVCWKTNFLPLLSLSAWASLCSEGASHSSVHPSLLPHKILSSEIPLRCSFFCKVTCHAVTSAQHPQCWLGVLAECFPGLCRIW